MNIKTITIEDKFNRPFTDIIEDAEALANNIAYEERWSNGFDVDVSIDNSNSDKKVYIVKIYER